MRRLRSTMSCDKGLSVGRVVTGVLDPVMRHARADNPAMALKLLEAKGVGVAFAIHPVADLARAQHAGDALLGEWFLAAARVTRGLHLADECVTLR
jgi:hypothetical protein